MGSTQRKVWVSGSWGVLVARLVEAQHSGSECDPITYQPSDPPVPCPVPIINCADVKYPRGSCVIQLTSLCTQVTFQRLSTFLLLHKNEFKISRIRAPLSHTGHLEKTVLTNGIVLCILDQYPSIGGVPLQTFTTHNLKTTSA